MRAPAAPMFATCCKCAQEPWDAQEPQGQSITSAAPERHPAAARHVAAQNRSALTGPAVCFDIPSSPSARLGRWRSISMGLNIGQRSSPGVALRLLVKGSRLSVVIDVIEGSFLTDHGGRAGAGRVVGPESAPPTPPRAKGEVRTDDMGGANASLRRSVARAATRTSGGRLPGRGAAGAAAIAAAPAHKLAPATPNKQARVGLLYDTVMERHSCLGELRNAAPQGCGRGHLENAARAPHNGQRPANHRGRRVAQQPRRTPSRARPELCCRDV